MNRNLVSLPSSLSTQPLPIVDAFYHRYGKAHLLFACHAALPLGLTPELLYNLWANFQVDCHGEPLGIPWIATANLLLSSLCEEVGIGLYEMQWPVRTALLNYLDADNRFGAKRIRELSAFLDAYIQPKLKSDNPEIRAFSQVQSWVSNAYLCPEKAAQELYITLNQVFQSQLSDLLRIASIVQALEKPLAHYPELLNYAYWMAKYAQGDIEIAREEMKKNQQSQSLHRLTEVHTTSHQIAHQQIMAKPNKRRIKLLSLAQILAIITVCAATITNLWLFRSGFFNTEGLTGLDSADEPSTLPTATEENNTILLFTTDRYTVRIYRNSDQTLMSVYDATFDINRQFEAPTQFTMLNGQGTYVSTGSFGGRQARYEVTVINPERIRLLIQDGGGNLIGNQLSTSVSISRTDSLFEEFYNTILQFNTPTYAIRVFERQDEVSNRFMNVYNRFTGVAEVNANAASLAPSLPPYERSVSYVSSANRSGQPVEYFVRMDDTGSTRLEIYNINGQRMFQETGEGPVTVNIPGSDFPAGVDVIALVAESAYVAAVSGDVNTLAELQTLYPRAFMDEARQGRFINVGDFPNRDSAMARVFELRGQGFDARLMFRDVQYREEPVP
ncbi:MAG: hypothetical protein F6K42_20010 [Leptolyngbya sp. SIO1D8]|nr:hypothetical protein [Leptolyngbya sp. SIO1D8]